MEHAYIPYTYPSIRNHDIYINAEMTTISFLRIIACGGGRENVKEKKSIYIRKRRHLQAGSRCMFVWHRGVRFPVGDTVCFMHG